MKVISVSFGELFLKGKNRRTFVDKEIRQIKRALSGFDIDNLYLEQGKYYIEADESQFDGIISKLKNVFGISIISLCYRSSKDLDDIKKNLKDVIDEYLEKNGPAKRTFKISSKRSDKSYPLTSPEINGDLGGFVLKNYRDFDVDVHRPDLEIFVEIRAKAYIIIEKIKGVGGLPLGSGGRGLLLLSGGIDSPVAGYQIAKRGVELSCLYFNSFPFTNQRAEDKARRLADKLSEYVGKMTYYSVNLLSAYTAINKNCKQRYTTILARRMMMRIAERIAGENRHDALITGESLGQVASQTIQGMRVVDAATDMLILRPLVAMDKTDIIDISEKIETYDISIEPFADCCSFFAPDKPVTKPRLSDVLREEENLDIDKLVDEALSTMEIVRIGD